MSHDTNSLDDALATAIENLARPIGDEISHTTLPDPRQLAVDFDEAYTTFVDRLDALPDESQLRCLQALDDALNAMTGPEHADLWSAASYRNHPHWSEVRELAALVLAQFR